MKLTKKVLSIILAAALVLGSVAVAANAADIVYGLEGSVLTMSVTSDKDVADGKAEVKPGEKITVSVAYTTNFYPGSAGVDLFVWTKGVFDDAATVATMVGADDYWDVLANFPLKSGYPSDYPATSYSGYLNTRGELTDYVGGELEVLDNEVFYTFEFTVPEDAEIGSVVDFVIPQSKVYGGTGSTRGFIRQNVSDSNIYDVVASSYCETVNVDSLQITVVEDKPAEPEKPEIVYGLEGSVLTMDVTSDKDVADGFAEVKPGEKITVNVAYTTNFYPGSAGVDLFVWTKGVFDDDATVATMVGADDYWDVLANFPLKSGYPSDYPATSYSGYLNTRGELTDYVGGELKILNKEIFYTFEFTVPEDAEIGSVVDFVIPQSKVYGGTGSTRGFIRQNVSDSNIYDVVASSYCETVNVDSLKITVVGEGGGDPVVEYADLTALKAALDKAAVADTANCTSATVAEFNAAKAAAEALNVEGTLKDQQEAVNAAAQRLEDAITGLKKLDKVNYEALEAAKDAYEAKVADKANYSNWAAYEALYNTAAAIDTTVVYDDEAGSIQAAVDAAASALADFALVEYGKVNYTALNDAIAAYEAKVADKDNYSNWADYEALYNAAKAIDQSIVYDKNGEQAAADEAAAALNNFVLVEYAKVNYDALNDAIAAYEAKVADKDIYANWADYEALYNAAKAIDQSVVYDKNGEQKAADDAAAALNAFVLVEYAKVNYDALNDAIAAYEAKVADKDIYANWADYEALYNAAKEIDQTVVYDKNGEQAAVDAAADALANFQLEEKTLSYDKWNAAVDAIPADLAGFKPASVTAYEAAKAAAEADKAAAVEALDQAALDAAADALTAAIALLEEKADNSALAAAIARASALLEENYTPDSWVAADLANVLAAANVVLANGDATAEEIAEQVAAIEAAEDKLVVKADKAALLEALQAAQALVENEAAYTPASFAEANLAAVMADAQVVYDDDNATAQAVADAITALKAAEAKLVLKADKTALEAAINTEVVLENATAETLAEYNAKLQAAQAVLADDNASEEDVLTATNNLLAAIDGIKYLGTCDYDELNAVIAEAEALNPDDYTTTSWYSQAYLNAYLDAAKEVAPDMIADEAGENQAIIDAAALALRTAIDTLELRANLADLKAAIAAEPKVAEEYATEDTWAAYAEKLAAAQAIVDEEYAVGVSRQAEVDEAAAALVAANDALVEADADYTAVEEALAYVETKGELNQYTQASVKKLQAAIDAVVYGLGISKQDEVNAAAEAIVKAADALEISEAAVSNVEMLGGEYLARETRQYEVTVAGAPSRVQFINEKGGTITFDRKNRNVTVVSYDAEGNVVDYAEVEPAYEVWTVSASLGEGTYQAKAKIGSAWEAFTYEFEIEFVDKADDEIYFVAAPADGSAEAGKTLELNGSGSPATITVVVPNTVVKVQLAFSIGCTTTYIETSANATVVDNGDGTSTWTLIRNFSNIGTYEMSLKLKDKAGWYDAVTEAINVTVNK
ncbi:MAG: hypothetical protein IKK09_02420 [Clostridia bacterium]|nr:hypothetical protein [Clostridia bacterium]